MEWCQLSSTHLSLTRLVEVEAEAVLRLQWFPQSPTIILAQAGNEDVGADIFLFIGN